MSPATAYWLVPSAGTTLALMLVIWCFFDERRKGRLSKTGEWVSGIAASLVGLAFCYGFLMFIMMVIVACPYKGSIYVRDKDYRHFEQSIAVWRHELDDYEPLGYGSSEIEENRIPLGYRFISPANKRPPIDCRPQSICCTFIVTRPVTPLATWWEWKCWQAPEDQPNYFELVSVSVGEKVYKKYGAHIERLTNPGDPTQQSKFRAWAGPIVSRNLPSWLHLEPNTLEFYFKCPDDDA